VHVLASRSNLQFPDTPAWTLDHPIENLEISGGGMAFVSQALFKPHRKLSNGDRAWRDVTISCDFSYAGPDILARKLDFSLMFRWPSIICHGSGKASGVGIRNVESGCTVGGCPRARVQLPDTNSTRLSGAMTNDRGPTEHQTEIQFPWRECQDPRKKNRRNCNVPASAITFDNFR